MSPGNMPALKQTLLLPTVKESQAAIVTTLPHKPQPIHFNVNGFENQTHDTTFFQFTFFHLLAIPVGWRSQDDSVDQDAMCNIWEHWVSQLQLSDNTASNTKSDKSKT